ncbi:MAG: M36 family metallopeptidase [Nocardioidaceae bacterium]
MFDSYLMQESATSMLDARDAYLAADKMRFGGRNLAAIWRGFAGDGMGEDAMTMGTEDDEPTSDYTSPFANEGTLKITGLGLDGQHSRSRFPARCTSATTRRGSPRSPTRSRRRRCLTPCRWCLGAMTSCSRQTATA